MNEKPLVGISKCLLGFKVRYDGGHKLDHYIHDIFGRYVEFIPVCPEVESGMSVPREAIHLSNESGEIRLRTQKTGVDKSEQMVSWSKKRIRELSVTPLCGYILKSKSPSCGLSKVKIYKKGIVEKSDRGIFAQHLITAFPLLPIEDEGRLHDPDIRENFIERVFVVHRWNRLLEQEKSLSNLMTFHAQHKYMIMAHSPKLLKELGAFIAGAKKTNISKVQNHYFSCLCEALTTNATVKKNTNVLMHITGYFRNNLTQDEHTEICEIIDTYHNHLVPLIVPVTLINHYVRKYKPPYLEHQYYLHPHPMELMLRNHV
jgi:uncharacterized protein YbgA (DUF1722 family)/uncharacterized protein YbbK (DUF523 family)